MGYKSSEGASVLGQNPAPRLVVYNARNAVPVYCTDIGSTVQFLPAEYAA